MGLRFFANICKAEDLSLNWSPISVIALITRRLLIFIDTHYDRNRRECLAFRDAIAKDTIHRSGADDSASHRSRSLAVF
jgi:hypothetical protein